MDALSIEGWSSCVGGIVLLCLVIFFFPMVKCGNEMSALLTTRLRGRETTYWCLCLYFKLNCIDSWPSILTFNGQ